MPARMGSVMDDTPRVPGGASLPDDPAALKALVARMQSRLDALEMKSQHFELKSLRLEMELLKYKKWVYGPRADRLKSLGDVAQMLLGFGEELDRRPAPASDEVAGLAAQDPGAAKSEAPSRRVKRGRRNLGADAFEHLPVTRHEHDLPEDQKPCPCCGTVRQRIGQDVTWQIEYIPGHFERLEHVQFKYACTHCEQNAAPTGPQIQRADRPGAAIDRGLAGPGLLAFVVTSKYSEYLPLYRLEDIFERSGFAIARSTMSLWCGDVAELVTPLYNRMIERVLRSRVIGTDDTIMPMLNPGAGKASKARMWVYVGGSVMMTTRTRSSTLRSAALATGRRSS